jgi:hypothetical protein
MTLPSGAACHAITAGRESAGEAMCRFVLFTPRHTSKKVDNGRIAGGHRQDNTWIGQSCACPPPILPNISLHDDWVHYLLISHSSSSPKSEFSRPGERNSVFASVANFKVRSCWDLSFS